MSRSVFVSYAHEDRDFAARVEDHLKAKGFRVIRDQTHLHPGERFAMSLDEALSKSFAVVLVLTPRSEQSVNVTYEWAHALGRGLPVIPLLRETTACRVHQLASLQYCDFRHTVEPGDDLFIRLHDLEESLDSTLLRSLAGSLETLTE